MNIDDSYDILIPDQICFGRRVSNPISMLCVIKHVSMGNECLANRPSTISGGFRTECAPARAVAVRTLLLSGAKTRYYRWY